jgi:hypothetical protein
MISYYSFNKNIKIGGLLPNYWFIYCFSLSLDLNKIKIIYRVTGFKTNSEFWTFRAPFWLQCCVTGWLSFVTICMVTGSCLGSGFWSQSWVSNASKTSGNDCARCFCCDKRRKSRNVVVDLTLPPWPRLLFVELIIN